MSLASLALAASANWVSVSNWRERRDCNSESNERLAFSVSVRAACTSFNLAEATRSRSNKEW